jgi:hypothetical protein
MPSDCLQISEDKIKASSVSLAFQKKIIVGVVKNAAVLRSGRKEVPPVAVQMRRASERKFARL